MIPVWYHEAAEILPGLRGCLLRKFRYSLVYSVEYVEQVLDLGAISGNGEAREQL